LAAVILWRAMIQSILWHGHTKRYTQAVEHLHDCAAVDVTLDDYEDILPHDAYLRHLRTEYANKAVFWGKVIV